MDIKPVPAANLDPLWSKRPCPDAKNAIETATPDVSYRLPSLALLFLGRIFHSFPLAPSSHHPTTSTWPYMLPPRTQTHHSFKFHFYPFPAQPLYRLIERPFLRLSKQHCHGDLLVKKGAIKTHNHFAQKERKLSDAGPESVGTIYGIKSEMNPRQQQQQQQTAHKPWNVWNLCTKNTTHSAALVGGACRMSRGIRDINNDITQLSNAHLELLSSEVLCRVPDRKDS